MLHISWFDNSQIKRDIWRNFYAKHLSYWLRNDSSSSLLVSSSLQDIIIVWVHDRRAATAWRHVICFCWTGCTELARYIALFCTSYACGYVSTFTYYVVFISTLQYRSLIIIYWCNVRLVIKQCTLYITCWCCCFICVLQRLIICNRSVWKVLDLNVSNIA